MDHPQFKDPFDTGLAAPAGQQALRARLLPGGDWRPFPPISGRRSLSDRFEEIVEQYPDKPAVKSRRRTLSYGRLNEAANRLARALLAEYRPAAEPAVGPVAVLCALDIFLPVAIMATLKAGKIVVTLDASDPPARLRQMLALTGCNVIVTEASQAAKAREVLPPGGRLLYADEAGQQARSSHNLGLKLAPKSLCWILFTSGSTGTPKGVMRTQGIATHLVQNFTNLLHTGPEDRWLLLNPLFTMDTLGPLLLGATLYPFDVRREGIAALVAWMSQEAITTYRSSPTVFRTFVESLTGAEDFSRLRLLQLAGESLSREDVALYQAHFPSHCILANRYGQNESGTVAIYYIDHNTEISGRTAPVGYPNAAYEILLLDENGQPVADGEIGEIAVRSAHLSLGYWGRPDLTQERFRPDPDGGERRIYLSGDLGRRQPDGLLEFHGRTDFQVKVRGYRVELHEVEAALLQIAGVSQAAVGKAEGRRLAVRPKDEEVRLVAYVEPAARPGPSADELRRALAERLPDYMVPAVFVLLDKLPLLPNGKVNRRALPAPDFSRPALAEPYVAPATPEEAAVAAIWAEVLELESVGVRDHFLDLGGDSLRATQIINRIRWQFPVALSESDLLNAPTVAEQAGIVAGRLVG